MTPDLHARIADDANRLIALFDDPDMGKTVDERLGVRFRGENVSLLHLAERLIRPSVKRIEPSDPKIGVLRPRSGLALALTAEERHVETKRELRRLQQQAKRVFRLALIRHEATGRLGEATVVIGRMLTGIEHELAQTMKASAPRERIWNRRRIRDIESTMRLMPAGLGAFDAHAALGQERLDRIETLRDLRRFKREAKAAVMGR